MKTLTKTFFHRSGITCAASRVLGPALIVVALFPACDGSGVTAEAGPDQSPDASAERAAADTQADGGAAKAPDGASAALPATQNCSTSSECASGFCVDGVCCDTACYGSCQSCSLTGKVGTCSPVKNATDDTCGGGSICDSVGMCREDIGKTCTGPNDCASGSCVDGVCCASAACGTCQSCAMPGSLGICSPVPRLTEDANSGCSGSSTCNGVGECRKKDGQTCATVTDCVSQQCTDGVCCNTACTDTCYRCDQPSSVGTCAPLDRAEDVSATITCSGSSLCSAPAGAAPTCRMKISDGQACTFDLECLSGICATYHRDADGDGYGAAAEVRLCGAHAAPGYTTTIGDCCDSDAAAHPGTVAFSTAKDACGSFDWNCNGVAEIGTGSTGSCGCMTFTGGGNLPGATVCTSCR